LNISKALSGRKFSDEHKERLKIARSKQKYIRYDGLEIDGVYYKSVNDAVLSLDIKCHVIKLRCKNNKLFPSWKRIVKGEN